MLSPKKTKYRKQFKGKIHGLAKGGFTLNFGSYGLKSEEPERVFSRREIMQCLWQSSYVGDERASDVHVANLRQKIERDPANPERIVTVRGAGYKLVAV